MLLNKPYQEVDEYESFYKGNMESNGISSIYIQRTGQKRDGCGIFYKHDRYVKFAFVSYGISRHSIYRVNELIEQKNP